MSLRSRKTAAVISKLSKQLNRLCWNAAALLLTAMLLTVGLQVVARYVFFSPPSWTEELARYFMIWAGLLGATVAFYRREDAVLMKQPKLKSPISRTMAAGIRGLAVIIFLVPLVYFSPPILEHHTHRLTDSTQISLAWIFIIVPLFAVIILVHLLAQVLGGHGLDDDQHRHL